MDISKFFNTQGFGVLGKTEANFDGNGSYYVLSHPQNITIGAVLYWTEKLGQGDDNVAATGQSIELPSSISIGTLYLLASAINGSATSSMTVTYLEGPNSTTSVNLPDWQFSNRHQLEQVDYREWPLSIGGDNATLYSFPVYVDPSRKPDRLLLPNNPRIHIFAITALPISVGLCIVSTDVDLREGLAAVRIHHTGTDWITKRVLVRLDGAGLSTKQPTVLSTLAPGYMHRIPVKVTARKATADGTVVVRVTDESGQDLARPFSFEWHSGSPGEYMPAEGSLKQHRPPQWLKDAKFGIFIHWGVYSVPAWAPVGKEYAEWYWWQMNDPNDPTHEYHRTHYGIHFAYDQFVNSSELANGFDPRDWLDIIDASRARYFVFTSKHHDGWANWNTLVSNRSLARMGPKRDIMHEVMEMAKSSYSHIKRGIYFSLPEWYNPAYYDAPLDWHGLPHNPYTEQEIPYTGNPPLKDFVNELQLPQALELIDQFQPDIFWCDIGGVNNSTQWQARFFNEAAQQGRQVTVNDRCGNNASDFQTVEYTSLTDMPPRLWESTRGIDSFSFGYNRATEPAQYASATSLIQELVDIVASGGNFLLNMGPNATGQVVEPMASRLRDMGAWIDRVGPECLFNTTPHWPLSSTNSSNVRVRFTASGANDDTAFYIFCLDEPPSSLAIDAPLPIHPNAKISSGNNGSLQLPWSKNEDGHLVLQVSEQIRQSESAVWVFKVNNP